MNHPFVESLTNKLQCQKCGFDALAHSDSFECEVCPNIGPVEVYVDSYTHTKTLMCPSCIEKETKADALLTEAREKMEIVRLSQAIDSTIEVHTDLFNAATVAITELKAAIDNDSTVENKNYRLAEVLSERFSHFKKVIFEAQKTIVESSNHQKSIQTYLNNLANSLRAEEREKLKLADINYKPEPPKSIKPKVIKTKKIDKTEIRKYAAELGVPEFMLQMVCVQKGCSVEDAANQIRRSMAEAKSLTSK